MTLSSALLPQPSQDTRPTNRSESPGGKGEVTPGRGGALDASDTDALSSLGNLIEQDSHALDTTS